MGSNETLSALRKDRNCHLVQSALFGAGLGWEMKSLKELFFSAEQVPGGEGGANVANPNSNDNNTAAAASTDLDEPQRNPCELDENVKPPTHGNNKKSTNKKSVQFSNFCREQPIDNEAPAADALQDCPIVNSVKGKCPAGQHT